MNITHAKISGELNPTDVTKIGGEDWDEPHVFSGLKLLGSFRVDRDESMNVTFLDVVGIATPSVVSNTAGNLALGIPEIDVSISTLNRLVVHAPHQYNRSLQRLQVYECTFFQNPSDGVLIKFYLINTADNSSNSFGTRFWAVVNIYEVI